MKVVLVALLVVILLLAGLPVPMAMAGMGTCEQCTEPTVLMLGCLAILLSFGLILPSAWLFAPARRSVVRSLLLASRPDRPPPLA
jgi:uncharacterized protein (DUF486 family)